MASYRTQVNAIIDQMLSPAVRSHMLAEIARQKRDELIQAGNAAPTYTTTVDGQQGASEDQVKGTGGGVIHYHFSSIGEAAAFALDFLKGRASAYPDFAKSFWVSVNGRLVPAAQFNPKFVPSGAEVILGNTEPWNRKLDVQLVGTRKLRFSAQPNMYDDAARAVARRFGNSVSTSRKYDYNFPGRYRPVKTKRFQSPVLILKEG